MADYIRYPPVMKIQGGPKTEQNVIRVDAAIRLRWMCAKEHDHRFRFIALLCDLLKGDE